MDQHGIVKRCNDLEPRFDREAAGEPQDVGTSGLHGEISKAVGFLKMSII
jgi:hypothetical protein